MIWDVLVYVFVHGEISINKNDLTLVKCFIRALALLSQRQFFLDSPFRTPFI